MGRKQKNNANDPAPISQFDFFDDEGPPQPISVFEFLDDDEPAPEQDFVPAAPLPYAPAVPTNPWAAMDADYRLPPGPPPSATVTALFDPHAPPEIIARRARLEFPALVSWILLTCLLQNLGVWLVLGSVLIAFSYLMRMPFQLCGLRGQAGIYRALGIGQLLFSLCTVVNMPQFATPLAFYGLGVLLSWVFVEARQLWLIERDESRRYSTLY